MNEWQLVPKKLISCLKNKDFLGLRNEMSQNQKLKIHFCGFHF